MSMRRIYQDLTTDEDVDRQIRHLKNHVGEAGCLCAPACDRNGFRGPIHTNDETVWPYQTGSQKHGIPRATAHIEHPYPAVESRQPQGVVR